MREPSARSLRGKGGDAGNKTIARNFRSGAECLTAFGTVPSSSLVTAPGCAGRWTLLTRCIAEVPPDRGPKKKRDRGPTQQP